VEIDDVLGRGAGHGDRDRMRKWTGMARNLKRTAMRYDAAFIEAVDAALGMRLVEGRSSDA
jgi:hypothetical protein